MTTRERTAKALDMTHNVGERGPRTMKARQILAAYLDGAAKVRITTVRALCGYLEMVAKQ